MFVCVCAQLGSSLSMARSNSWLGFKGQNKTQCYFYKVISTHIRRLNEKSMCSFLAPPNLLLPSFFNTNFVL